jgi:lysophospholipase
VGGEAAPLLETPAARVPARAVAEWVIAPDAARLRAALFPSTAPMRRGSVVLSPGRTEPIEKYFEVIERLAARGYVVLAHDWRGQGLSDRGRRARGGDARGTGRFMSDYATLLAAFEARLPKPWIALGHSMGGCLSLLALARGEARFSAAMLSAPMLGLNTGPIPPAFASGVAQILARLGQGSNPARPDTGWQAFETNVLTHDEARYRRNLGQVEAWEQLDVGPPTWGWLDFAFAAMRELAKGPGAPRISIPLTVAAAGEEQIVDNAWAQRITARIPGARYVVIPGAYHEILQETDAIQAPFWKEFDDLTARVAA